MRMQLSMKNLLSVALVWCFTQLPIYAQTPSGSPISQNDLERWETSNTNKHKTGNPSGSAKSTQDGEEPEKPKKLNEADLNILFSYYSQDGDNAAVTGGIGTEKLSDYASAIIVNVPINDKNKVSFNGGVDYYTSASSDNIDPHRSSASSKDMRIYGTLGYTRTNPKKGISYGVKAAGSSEYDYFSAQMGANFSKTSADKNREIALSSQVFIDQWSIIYPRELRGRDWVSTNKRQSYSLTATYSQVINKRMQAAITTDFVFQRGLLSTPFNRVYFEGQNQARVEQLPDKRFKLPIGVRFNYFANDYLLMRLNYRFYWDDWGVLGNTFEVETPIKINRFFSIYPYYRFHTQTAADYFQSYAQHALGAVFYTSDYDLAKLHSHKIGGGIRFSPPNGIVRIKRPFNKKGKLVMFKGIDLRYAHYRRSTGLKANIITTGLNIGF